MNTAEVRRCFVVFHLDMLTVVRDGDAFGGDIAAYS
jgi:hypothetical protein